MILGPGTKMYSNEILIVNTGTFYISVLNLIYKIIYK